MPPTRVPLLVSAKPPSILVVDADPDTRALYRCAFELQGYEVLEAGDGREALTKALVRTPALVVTETTLAHVDGYALCEILRRDRTTTGIPIVVVAAEAHPAHAQRARKAGATLVLIKPVGIDRIVVELHRLLTASMGEPLDRGDVIVPFNPALDEAVSTGRPPSRRSRTRSFVRSTIVSSRPPLFEPVCPSCDRSLTYERSHIVGVNAQNAERWDDFSCPSCGTFQYRSRTRKLTRRTP